MAILYSIRDWDENFEIAQSRKSDGPLNWVAVPTKHDGKSYRRLMLMPEGAAIYGAWVLLIQIAAKCPRRGILADNDGPLTAADCHIKTGAPEGLFTKALSILSSPHIGWIVGVEWETSGRALPPHNSTEQYKQTICGEDATVSDQSEDGSGTADANGSEDGDKATSKATGNLSYPQAFEDFWLAYPTRGGRKRGKGKCYGIWRKAIRSADRQQLVEAARNYAASDDSTRGFAKDPERFLAADWWRDWLTPVVQVAPIHHQQTEVSRRIQPANFIQ